MFAIEVRNLSKKYYISKSRLNYLSARDKISEVIRHPLTSLRNNKKEEFWALKDINFSITKGEVVGVIGVNGAGKSTLLKVLSKITTPDYGLIKIRGKISSLLEVGAGFHPELTGRENIYLNGSILGMSKKEMDNSFKEIVNFSGVEKFLDNQVKYYSSGMYVRLAFSVAAHLNSDILLIDEVLAVGDTEFQRKCFEKISESVNDRKKTVLFVSHNIGAIQNLCKKCFLLDRGKIEMFDDTEKVIEHYLENISKISPASSNEPHHRKCTGGLIITEVVCFGDDEKVKDIFLSGCQIKIMIKYKVNMKTVDNIVFHLGINSSFGFRIITLSNKYVNKEAYRASAGSGYIICRIPKIPFIPGKYFIDVTCRVNYSDISDNILSAKSFTVEDGNFYRNGRNPKEQKYGFFMVDHEWIVN